MTVTASKLNRDTYEVGYAEGAGPGPINATLTNSENGDVSSYQGPDDGKFLVTVAVGYAGSADVEIRKLEKAPRPDPKGAEIEIKWDLGGRKIDSGTVTFGAEIDQELPDGEKPVDPGYGVDEEPPPGISNELPEGPVFPNNDLPWDLAHPDHDLPWSPARPDNTLPGAPGHPDNELPPEAGTKPVDPDAPEPDNELPETAEPK